MPDKLDYPLDDLPEPMSAAERTRQWRERKKLEGRPEMKAVDSAISEATAFLVSIAPEGAAVSIDLANLVRVAVIALVREGYSRSHSSACVTARLKPRDDHDHLERMPSRKLHSRDALIQPRPDGRPWREQDIAFIRSLTGK